MQEVERERERERGWMRDIYNQCRKTRERVNRRNEVSSLFGMSGGEWSGRKGGKVGIQTNKTN